MLWWAIPDVLAGMPMPYVHPERRMNPDGSLGRYEDDLPRLYGAGVRGVVCLLNIASDATVYASAGFEFLCLPIPDGCAPSRGQADEFVAFVDQQRSSHKPVVVHCLAGAGRTGTMIAAYLIGKGAKAVDAIQRVRTVAPHAIETPGQVQFLEEYALMKGMV